MTIMHQYLLEVFRWRFVALHLYIIRSEIYSSETLYSLCLCKYLTECSGFSNEAAQTGELPVKFPVKTVKTVM